MRLCKTIALILLVTPTIARAQEEAQTPKSVAELQQLLKATIENNRKLATHAERMSTELVAVRKEMNELRSDIRKTMAERDKLFNQVVQLTDQMYQLQGVVKGLKERNTQLAEQLAKVNKHLARIVANRFASMASSQPLARGCWRSRSAPTTACEWVPSSMFFAKLRVLGESKS